MNNKTQMLLKVIEYSQSMLKDAGNSDWENVIATESVRNKILNQLFSEPFTKIEQEENNELIMQILTINKNIESITAQAREKIQQEMSLIGKGRNAIGAYAQNAG